MDELPSPRIESVWTKYDQDRDGDCGGIYIFLLRPFGNAPYLVGETATFSNRLADHNKFFAKGLRTFFRKPFVDGADHRSHIGFGRRWEAIRRLRCAERQAFLFVPTSSENLAVADEGMSYIRDLVIPIVWKIASTKKGRESLETRMQNAIEDYYPDICGCDVSLQIPDTKSSLVGRKQGDPKAAPFIGHSFSLSGESCLSSKQFFQSLETPGFV